jgi:uncharacterized protein (TIGR02246 family)
MSKRNFLFNLANVFALISLIASHGYAQQNTTNQLSQAEKEVRKLEREWLDAYEKRDSEAMNRILADDFKITYGNGMVRTKSDVLEEFKAAPNSGQAPPKFSTQETETIVEGDSITTITLTGIFVQQGGRGTMRARYKDVYVKRDGRWQVLSSQLTRIPPTQNQNGTNQSSGATQSKEIVPVATQTIDRKTKEQVINIASYLLEDIYVLSENGKKIAAQLRAKFESGAYDAITDIAQFYSTVTSDLQAMGKDRHLNLRYQPSADASATILTPQEWDKLKPTIFTKGSYTPQAQTATVPDARVLERLRQTNYAFRQAKHLEGNIGYLDLGGFMMGEEARAAADKAMASLANSDAVIIDLRRCPGGGEAGVSYLASYFFPKEPRVLMTRYSRPSDITYESKTVADLPGKRMIDADLYILVGSGTASACESFPYTLQQFGRAKIVGERTVGAGYNNFFVPIGKGFELSISFGNPKHPVSGKGWEGEGVQPDIQISASKALEAAQKEALLKLIGKTKDEKRKTELTNALQNLERTIAAQKLAKPPSNLQDYVGRYGNVEISVKDDELYFQRIGRAGASLTATGKDKFALNDSPIQFVRDRDSGNITQMVIDWIDRGREQLKREITRITAPQNQPPQNQSQTRNNFSVDESAAVKELTSLMEQSAAGDAFSGAVLIAQNGREVFKKAYGLANKKNNAPNDTETKFNLGSMNKMFTAVAVAQLAEKGKLSFDDTISKHLPNYPNKEIADKVTIHQLLTHSSGMGSYQNEKFFANLDKIKTNSDLLPFFADQPLAFEPGSRWQYSNSGFVVLGLIIEKISGKSYFDYVRENIFKPAGMQDTASYEKTANVANLATGYTRMNPGGQADLTQPRRENLDSRPLKGSSAGGGYSTLEDLLKFALALQNHKLLGKNFTDIVTTGKIKDSGGVGKFGYGFADMLFGDKRIFGHNGGGPGIAANLDIFPETGYVSIVMSNYDPPQMFPVMIKARELIVPITGAEQEVRKLEREWLDAYEKRDAEAMNRILADNFKLTFPDGRTQTKADIIAELKTPPDPSRPSPKLSTEGTQAQVQGDTVTLIGRFIQRSENKTGGGQPRMMQARYLDIYVKRDGRWQVVKSQLSRAPQ